MYNFSCPYCGDSAKKKSKARGFLYRKGNSLFYRCHNCDFGTTLAKFLEFLDPPTAQRYLLECFKEGTPKNAPIPQPEFKSSQPYFLNKNILIPLLQFPANHPIRTYAASRRIPEDRMEELFGVEETRSLADLNPDLYEGKFRTKESRLVFPFKTRRGDLVGACARDVTGTSEQRYLVVKIDPEEPLIFNWNNVNLGRTIYCVEGPLDSLFLPNAIAAGGADLKKALAHFPKERLVLCFDNEPRNVEIVRRVESAVETGVQIFLSPKSLTGIKDINDWSKTATQTEILEIIKANTFSGLSARLAFAQWRIA